MYLYLSAVHAGTECFSRVAMLIKHMLCWCIWVLSVRILQTKLSSTLVLVCLNRALNITKSSLKRPSHSKLKLANSCLQTQVGVCERRKNSRQTRWQTVGDKQNLSLLSPTFSCWQTRIWRANGWQTCVGDCQPIKTRTLFTWHFTKWQTDVKTNV